MKVGFGYRFLRNLRIDILPKYITILITIKKLYKPNQGSDQETSRSHEFKFINDSHSQYSNEQKLIGKQISTFFWAIRP
jgi:hypothetical protein